MFSRRGVMQGLALGALAAAATPVRAEGSEIHVIADILAKPEAADQFRKLLMDFVAEARKENGCQHYTLLEDPAKPGHFYTFEIWADKAALDAHLNSPAMKAIGPKIKDMLAAAPVITPLKILSES